MDNATATKPLATATAVSRLSNEAGRALLTVRGQHFVIDSPGALEGPNEAPQPRRAGAVRAGFLLCVPVREGRPGTGYALARCRRNRCR